MSLHITIRTVIQTAMTKGGTDKISTPPTWSYNHTFSSNFFYYRHIIPFEDCYQIKSPGSYLLMIQKPYLLQ
jgi:hypothetical protein